MHKLQCYPRGLDFPFLSSHKFKTYILIQLKILMPCNYFALALAHQS